MIKTIEDRLKEMGAVEGTSTAVSRHYEWQKGSGGVSNPYNSHHQVHNPARDVRVPVTAWFVDGVRVAYRDPNNGRPTWTPEGRQMARA